ncbi:MAG: TonB-dependent receptor, partial [Flavobacteriaceae bacterium]|nr:TonB-dependent receptor [Flavobacteriaceae bacterium]
RTQGIDFVFTYNGKLNENSSYNVGIVGNMNDLKIDKIHNGVLNEFTFFSPFSRAYLKAAAPDYKLGLNFGFKSDKFAANATFTNFSKVKLQDFQWVDTPPTTQQEADALYAVATDIYRSAMTVDLNLSYQFSKSISFAVGGNNIFNQYPTPQFDGWTDQGGLMDSVQMGSDGAYFFGKLGFKF